MSDGFADDELVLTNWEEGYYARQLEEDDVVETLRVELVSLRAELERVTAERDAARLWAARWKLYAKSINWAMRQSYPRHMVLRKVRYWAYNKFGYQWGSEL